MVGQVDMVAWPATTTPSSMRLVLQFFSWWPWEVGGRAVAIVEMRICTVNVVRRCILDSGMRYSFVQASSLMTSYWCCWLNGVTALSFISRCFYHSHGWRCPLQASSASYVQLIPAYLNRDSNSYAMLISSLHRIILLSLQLLSSPTSGQKSSLQRVRKSDNHLNPHTGELQNCICDVFRGNKIVSQASTYDAVLASEVRR